MFIEAQPSGKSLCEAWLTRLSQKYPRAFFCAFVFSVIALTLGLMLDATSPIVLYQGF
ncbi:MAG: hypothetical protein L0387_14090 [Acidobacteria bacterium]|nr:hypothetical protein [Acidobacteriota bacterium]